MLSQNKLFGVKGLTGYDMGDSQKIEKHIFSEIADILGVNSSSPTKLQQILSYKVTNQAKDLTGGNQQDAALGPALSVYKLSSLYGIPKIKDSVSINIGVETYGRN